MTIRLASFFFALVLSSGADAQLFRAYLAAAGNDANPCTLAQPCRLLPAALAAVADGGEIWMLDSANYNTAMVNVAKSVSIVAIPGVVGSFVAVTAGQPAIWIGAHNLKVSLRNVVVVPLAGVVSSGIVVAYASELFVENSVIANMTGGGHGIEVYNAGAKLRVTGTTFRNIGAGGAGVYVGDNATATVSRSTFTNVGYGVTAATSYQGGTTLAGVSDSIFVGATIAAIDALTIADATVKVLVTRCTIDGGNAALRSQTTGFGATYVTVSNSMVTKNAKSFVQSGAGSVLRSLGNNHFTDNAGSTGVLTPVAPQ